jgi:hypothetical protein
MPEIAHIAALWTLAGHPPGGKPWTLDRKLEAIASAGFDGAAGLLTPAHRRLADRHGLRHLLGYISSDDPGEFEAKILSQKRGGAMHINVQMDNHDTPPEVAVRHWIRMERAAARVRGVVVSLEVHRDTCTETPEKTYEIAERYHLATGETIRLNFDFSHFAVVKHLRPASYVSRLLDHPELVRNSEQCHFRPFNGHHCQVAVMRGGSLTPEARAYLVFARAVMKVWKGARENRERTLFACPEMGPYDGFGRGGGYNISGLPPAWPDAVALRRELSRIWELVREA